MTDVGPVAHAATQAGLRAPATRLLLVEDDEGDAFLVRELLLEAAADVEIVRVGSLGQAHQQLPGGRFDCVLLDLGLPDATDLQALRGVLDAAPHIAVLVLTGLSDEHRGTAAVAAGAQDYLVKGTIDGQLLTRAIRYAVERKRADESIRLLFESELQAAENARLERGLLPQPLVSGTVEVVCRYRPGRHQSLLGGDFYDAVERADGTLFALIGDVAGHGPDEAALGVCLRIAWRTLVLARVEPETILPAMQAVLVSERGSDEVFATVSMVRVDPERRSARFWLAGHPLPMVIDGGLVRSVPDEAAGTALGILDGGRWPAVEVPVPAGGSLMLFTDGLIEGFDGLGHGNRLGESGLHALMSRLLARGLGTELLATVLLRQVQDRNGGELTDDVALLLLSFPSPDPTACA